MTSKEKAAARAAYKQMRDASPCNDKQTRRYWKSKYITAPNHAGLYVESINQDRGLPVFYKIKQIAKDSKQPIDRPDFQGFFPYVNTLPNYDTGESYFLSEWAARQALRLYTAAHDAAGNRERYIWDNSHCFTMSKDTAGIVVVYADKWTSSADIDTDDRRNGNGVRLWVN